MAPCPSQYRQDDLELDWSESQLTSRTRNSNKTQTRRKIYECWLICLRLVSHLYSPVTTDTCSLLNCWKYPRLTHSFSHSLTSDEHLRVGPVELGTADCSSGDISPVEVTRQTVDIDANRRLTCETSTTSTRSRSLWGHVTSLSRPETNQCGETNDCWTDQPSYWAPLTIS